MRTGSNPFSPVGKNQRMTLFGSAAAAAVAGTSDAAAPINATQAVRHKAFLRSIRIPGNEGGVMYHFGHAGSHVVRPLKPVYWDDATRALGQRDRVLRRLIRAYPDIHLRRRHDPFTTLARAIVGQQISVKAADSIWRRFVATVKPGARSTAFPRLDPVAVAAADVAPLRECGLSGRKVDYLRDLASRYGVDPAFYKELWGTIARKAEQVVEARTGCTEDVPHLPRASRRRASRRRHRPAARDCPALPRRCAPRRRPCAISPSRGGLPERRDVVSVAFADPIPVQY
jgi:hypothetical protein